MPHVADPPPPKCPECDDTGWPIVNSPESKLAPIAMPCRSCNIRSHAQWEHGHLSGRPHGGDCGFCMEKRQGGRVMMADVDPVLGVSTLSGP